MIMWVEAMVIIMLIDDGYCFFDDGYNSLRLNLDCENVGETMP